MEEQKNDFGQGSVAGNIMAMAVPMTVAQILNVLYNIVDRMYIGHIPGESSLALTGVGLTFPIISMVTAFSNLYGMGGSPLCSIARGEGKLDRAEEIMENSFWMLVGTGVILTVFFLAVQKPLLYAFGASDDTISYAVSYLTIYLLGNLFVMVGLGMNPFINAQGFGKVGMITVGLGAVINLILDPVFIFGLNMGVRGAALATIFSQFSSASEKTQDELGFMPADRVSGYLQFCDEFYQQRSADRLQPPASDLWRRSVRRRHDDSEFHPGSAGHAGERTYQRRAAGAQFQLWSP